MCLPEGRDKLPYHLGAAGLFLSLGNCSGR